mgnify:CR=1 FL=1
MSQADLAGGDRRNAYFPTDVAIPEPGTSDAPVYKLGPSSAVNRPRQGVYGDSLNEELKQRELEHPEARVIGSAFSLEDMDQMIEETEGQLRHTVAGIRVLEEAVRAATDPEDQERAEEERDRLKRIAAKLESGLTTMQEARQGLQAFGAREGPPQFEASAASTAASATPVGAGQGLGKRRTAATRAAQAQFDAETAAMHARLENLLGAPRGSIVVCDHRKPRP